ncbi:hypothetical protein K2173_009061 [Erythroxylum novogranatense]|uniref:EF-hand domain-containing protein n=1 Tax=Erythroxylum novogranatense TaxID=1862640 RepID=A0AAV8TVM7_9ROSI|nr:hypothetical protein K2173_009061 [Erythroxylum novogranatense]
MFRYNNTMGKASIIIYTAIAVFVLCLISHAPKKPTANHHRRLKIRSSFNLSNTNPLHRPHTPVPFDPLVAEIERRLEDKRWERQHFVNNLPELFNSSSDSAPGHESQPEWEDFMDSEDYLNDEGKFNVTNSLFLLFPKIDVDPSDGYVDEYELTEWNLRQALREVLHKTQREMEIHDKNHDGFISFSEYGPPNWVQNSGPNAFGYEMGWWKEEHFNASDTDGDGILNITEFNEFLHPADSKNPKLIEWLCKEEMRERDSDRDGKLNFNEFYRGLFDLVKNYDDESHDTSVSDGPSEAPAKMTFSQLDKDGDRYLNDTELQPIIGKLHPSERYYAKQQADYIISQADTDKDGRLSLYEMIESPYVFYNAIFNEEDDRDDYGFHDEFR